MKGQMVFEFVVAAVLFIGIVVFVMNILNANVAAFTNDYYKASMDAKAVAASESLLRGPDGLGKWPVIETGKAASFEAWCNTAANYTAELTRFGLTDKPYNGTYDVRIIIKEIDSGTVRMDCRPQVGPIMPGEVSGANVRRLGIMDTGEIVEINFWIW